MKSRGKVDVIVIGAGAAGLAAAREIAAAGRSVAVLEARQRIGGRILTVRQPGLPLPVELGPEFVHGEAAETMALVRTAGLAIAQLPDEHWWARGGVLEHVRDFWGEIARVSARIPEGGADTSFAEFLQRQKGLDDRRREMMLSFVEGYHAADPRRISAQALASGDSETADGSEKQARLVSGYDLLAQALRTSLDSDRGAVHLNVVAHRIERRNGEVRVRARSATGFERAPFRGSAAIVTLPLGVLKAPPGSVGALEFDPPLRRLSAILRALEMGNVMKIVLRFRSMFWAERPLPKPLRPRPGSPALDLNFFHDHGAPFPTWWTPAPAVAPFLTGWAGGPRADALAAAPEGALIGSALDSLAKILGAERKLLEEQLEGWWTHDWRADPFTRGAYSYVAAGGLAMQKAFARPFEKNIFFAGEATDREQTGTVAGAIASGRRAALQALRLF
jgi:monoamine oxidase